MSSNYDMMKPSRGPIILGADGNPAETDSNINTQELENPDASGKLPKDFLDKLSPEVREYFMEEALKSNREQLRKEVIEKGKTELKDDDLTFFKHPRKGCNKCYGIGRAGWSASTGEVVLCDCMRRGKLMNADPSEFITVEEFVAIFNVSKPVYPRAHTTPKSLRRVESRERKLEKKRRKHNAERN